MYVIDENKYISQYISSIYNTYDNEVVHPLLLSEEQVALVELHNLAKRWCCIGDVYICNTPNLVHSQIEPKCYWSPQT